MSLTLIIGTKKWSSWSLRPWIALKEAGIPFKEMLIHLRQSDTKARILEYSPAGKVPILIDGREMVWDSLAILEYLAVRFPESKLWPQRSCRRWPSRARFRPKCIPAFPISGANCRWISARTCRCRTCRSARRPMSSEYRRSGAMRGAVSAPQDRSCSGVLAMPMRCMRPWSPASGPITFPVDPVSDAYMDDPRPAVDEGVVSRGGRRRDRVTELRRYVGV